MEMMSLSFLSDEDLAAVFAVDVLRGIFGALCLQVLNEGIARAEDDLGIADLTDERAFDVTLTL